MGVAQIIGLVLIISGLIAISYFSFQLIRNVKVFKIRISWIKNNDIRHYKYTYDDMYEPNFNNWFGLKYPKDKHFK